MFEENSIFLIYKFSLEKFPPRERNALIFNVLIIDGRKS